MQSFLQRFASGVRGVLSGFDRLRFRGTRRMLAHARGFIHFLYQLNVSLPAFKDFALETTGQLCQRVQEDLHRIHRPCIPLAHSGTDKEALARDLAHRDGITQGTICVFSCQERASTYKPVRNAQGRRELRPAPGKCRHYYHYFIDPEVGFGHVRLQTWFPFAVHVQLNGREWLARQLDRAGVGYTRRDNCFTGLADFTRAQSLADEQLRTDWPALLDRLTQPLVAGLEPVFARCPVDYYWSLEQSEWATDILFRDPAQLQRWYPAWLRHGLFRLGSKDVLRYLGKRMPKTEGHYGNFDGEVLTDLKARREGARIKHWAGSNSIKLYDKAEVILRVETTLNDPRDLKVYRPKEGDEEGEKAWRVMRKGVADLHRRAQVCQAANERYVESLATVAEPSALGELVAGVCRPTRWQKRRVRALNPLGEADGALLRVVYRGEHLLAGLRNADVRVALYGAAKTEAERQRQSAAVTRQLRLLRAHGLIRKVSGTHRYQVSEEGRSVIGALLAARDAEIKTLVQAT
jgi:hypothetical protein